MFFKDLDSFVDSLFSCKDGVVGDVKVDTDQNGSRSITYVGDSGKFSITLGTSDKKFDVGFLTAMYLLYTRLAKVAGAADIGFKQLSDKKEEKQEPCKKEDDGDIIYRINFHAGEESCCECFDGLCDVEGLCSECFEDECNDYDDYHISVDVTIDRDLMDKLIEKDVVNIDSLINSIKSLR